MRKPIFESEEEAYDFLCDIGVVTSFLYDIKRFGFIKKTAVEEAEEMYDNFTKLGISLTNAEKLIELQHQVIQELKAGK